MFLNLFFIFVFPFVYYAFYFVRSVFLCCFVYRFSPKRPDGGVDHPPPFGAEVKERVEVHL